VLLNRRNFLAHALATGLLGTKLVRAGQTGFTIVALGSFSGAKATMGQDALDGVNLALKEAGFRLANLEVRLVVVDDKGEPGAAMAQAKHQIGIEPIDVVLTALTPSALSQVVPLYAAAGIFVLNLGMAPQSMAEQGCSPWFFDLAGDDDGLHEAAGLMLNNEGIKRAVVVGPDRPLTDHAAEVLARTFQGQILSTVKTGEGVATYGRELGMIRHLSPDGVYSVLTGGTGVAFVHSWGDSEPLGRPRLFAPWYNFERVQLSAMGDSALGISTVGTWASDVDNPVAHRMVAGFESDFGRVPSVWSCHGYDAVNVLDTVLKLGQGKMLDKEAFRNGLRHAELASPRGTIRFNSNHFPVLTYWQRQVVKDGKGRLGQETKGAIVRDWKGHASACPMRWEETSPAAANAKKKGP
jgi:branched-chain amino acid transport system substrate-binding protein